MESAPARSVNRPWLHLLLFVLTVGTTSFTFDKAFPMGPLPDSERLAHALTFSAALLSILGSHEMGHYVLARLHGVDASLPYFIPLPYLGVGTLGAVIRIRSRIPTRNALVDIGAAGPLAGLVVALPLLVWGLAHSTLVDAPPVRDVFPGDTSLWSLGGDLLQWARVKLSLAPAPPRELSDFGHQAIIFSDSLLMRGLKWLVLGPLPAGKDIQEHPVVIAGWFGLLVTLLNLIPVGQFDGGHLAFALWGRHARWVGRVMALVLLFLTLFYTITWGIWLLVATKVVGFGHPEVSQPTEPLGLGRKVVCAVCFLALAGCAMPVPIRMVIW
ncbi:site-2 protease family protein [Vitiosangium sp. GDMCC 1.1324]|uniref:site-2 protease family protein n=1 Tax=Vitiosangium sp. (strain GDMCC 1.1324) TaxID=2138576 RepID=UPI000D33FE72|nr:site-2 protease family protein [Vitiosangium sp. GDMCC 1.1324]PTL82950.1 site-2 protease family protein [Vitiosangium sp. GDMCC 1.1324]